MVGLLDGVTLRLSRKALSAMLGWGMYESVLLFLRKQKEKQRQNNKGD